MALGFAAVACGLSVSGTDPESPVDAGVDVRSRDVTPTPEDVTIADRFVPDDAEPPTPDASCDAGPGVFCNYCNPDLLLCLQFEGGIRDESLYQRSIVLDASEDGGTVNPTFVFGDGGFGALALDGSFAISVPPGPGLTDHRQFSVEILAKMRDLPRDAGRYGLYDRNSALLSFFVYGGDGGVSGPHLRCLGHEVDVELTTERYMHFACTADSTTDRVNAYLDGRRVIAAEGGTYAPPDGGWTGPLFLFANDPSGDVFQGEVASIRMFARVRTARAIARAAGDGGDAGDDD